ncbi:MAG TPA: hypothetical protein DEA96_12085 [Leptospiraceae bacterium]|nr:hypothetical protein [Spirochaetaceae bacterium]HBS05699.1 hypothetical protein [Leptospiraceae bacterium]
MIQQTDTSNAIYDPMDVKYWDPQSLQAELERSFDICNGCRMCFKYCPSFPTLFSILDGYADGDVKQIKDKDQNQVIDECYHCKICYVACPYTDKDDHAFNLNYPALMQRAVIVRAKKQGVPMRRKMLQNADLLGKVNTGLISRLANRALASNFHRAIAQTIVGIHKEKKLPEFHRTSFHRWFHLRKKKMEKEGRSLEVDPANKVVLFSTCFVNYNNPQVGKDAVEVLERHKCEIQCPSQNCCGMPGLESGDLKWVRKKMRANLKSLHPYAEKGYRILAINPTCSLTLKEEYVNFLEGEEREKAKLISKQTRDLHEFLFELKQEDKFDRNFKSSPESVAYHVPCHLRAQHIGYRSRDLMKLIPENKIGLVSECCSHDGTWAMRKEYFELSMKQGKKAFDELKEKEANVVTTDCPLAAIQLEQGMELNERPLHPVQILNRAYKSPQEGGFATAVPEKSED